MKDIKVLAVLVSRVKDAGYRINHASCIMYRASCFLAIIVTFTWIGLSSGIVMAQDDEIPFDVANIFFELNNTDGDLGIHALIDGEPWRKLEIEDPNERKILSVSNTGRLRQQGLTELFFESAEPPFDELPPERFFQRFPAGEYEISGITLEGDELESTDELRHVMPAPPAGILISGIPAAENCDADPLPSVDGGKPVIIRWDAVTESHPEIGTPTSSPNIVIVGYQVVVEREEPPLKVTFDLSQETRVVLTKGLFASGDEVKLEVLVREASGNQTAVETCFEVE